MKYCFIILFLLRSHIGYGQYNLVPNYSFEDNVVCPNAMNGGEVPSPWYLPQNVPNKFVFEHACSTSPFHSVPNNVVGFQYAKTGLGYAITDFYQAFSFNGRAYFQTQLKDSLKANKCYYGEYWVSLGNNSRIACNNIAMLLTDTAIWSAGSSNSPNFGYDLIPANPQIFNYGNPVITDTLNWVKISGVYTAQGGEEYITIGNFKDDAHTELIQVHNLPDGSNKAGYYIDDIWLIPLDSMFLHADAGADLTIIVGDSTYIGSYINGINDIIWYNSTGSIIATGIPGMYVKPPASTFYVIEQNVCGQYSKDTVYITVGVVPLVIKNYELKIKNEGVVNKWITLNEINVSHFNIQYSNNSRDFYTLQMVHAKNNTYNEYAVAIIPPLGGEGGYYRIEAVDKDGKITYSKTEKIQLKIDNEQLTIFPNPTTNIVNIAFKEMQQVIITDVTGRKLLSKQFIGTSNAQLNISSLRKGIFFVRVTDSKGNAQTEKLIVQ